MNKQDKLIQMKKAGFLVPLLGLGLFFFFIIASSPYRQLRPYEFFGKKIPDPAGQPAKFIEGRKAVFIPGTQETGGFYIDQIPVTIGAYKDCCASGKCLSHHYRESYEKYWDTSLYEIFPVSFVTFSEARDFCKAAGGDLPTARQWESAAGADQGYEYAWGNESPSISRANLDGYYQWLTPAGWLPAGASPYGVLDLNGNIREWILDQDPSDPEGQGLKGGSYQDSYSSCKNDYYFYHWPVSAGFNRGFRCVYEE